MCMTKDEIIKWIAWDIEGGDKITTDTGGVTKYGIAQKFNPEVDVRNLDEAGAIQVYDKKYWTPNGLDEYLFPVNLILFDAFVNGGGSDLKKLYETYHYHWAMLMISRADRYLYLCRKPKYRVYLRGWMNRLNKINHRIMEVMYGTPIR